MPYQPIKFYQAGSFVVGNRLLSDDERSVQARMERSNTLTSGHRACQGCGEALGARYVLDAALRAAQGRLIAANATGCLEVLSPACCASARARKASAWSRRARASSPLATSRSRA